MMSDLHIQAAMYVLPAGTSEHNTRPAITWGASNPCQHHHQELKVCSIGQTLS